MTLLIIFSAILIISIIMTIIGNRNDDYSWFFVIGLFVTILTLFFGFGVIGCTYPYNTSEIKIEKFTYAKTASAIVIETPLKTQIFTDAKMVNSVNDSSQLYYSVSYNAYGFEINRSIIIK